jgi:energy-coupling factor transporter ATP-binding protein EcfA2
MDFEEIDKIRNQFGNGLWPRFLEMVQIQGLRGWDDQGVQFRFPVVAVVGENGVGKSTLLKAAACAYSGPDKRPFYPSSFFLATHWDNIHDVALTYRVRTGAATSTYKIAKHTKRWSFPDSNVSTPVFWMDIARTLPLDATAGYAKLAKQTTAESGSSDLHPDFLGRLSHVMSRPYTSARFVKTNAGDEREVGLLGSPFGNVPRVISQFHQGAGEETTHDLFRTMQSMPDYSLLIIDEVEASLHPKAQRRLVRSLLWLSRQKRIQVILSTHSPYVLEELPPEARVLLLRTDSTLAVVYGASTEFAMSKIDEETHPELSLFVEDRPSQVLVREILASATSGSDVLPRVQICPVGSCNIVATLGKLASTGKLPYPGLGVVDADQQPTDGCIALPGHAAPERVVFGNLHEQNWPNLPQRFGIGAGALFQYLEDAMLEPDHHQWTALVGDNVRMSATRVWDILATEWCRSCLPSEERDAFVQAVIEVLNRPDV